jgi:glycosyltransferase involved in cell wall biosynthesis
MSHVAESKTYRPCAIIPTYNNEKTIRDTVQSVREWLPDIFVIDDGSDAPAAEECRRIAAKELAHVTHHDVNGGKGAAVKTGFREALAAGFTHALQVDADSQHDLNSIPHFLEVSRSSPHACVMGYPTYDDTVPSVRLKARKFTSLWVNLEVGDKETVKDAMVGFRVYPLSAVTSLHVPSNHMDFDVEIAVKMAWADIPIINEPVKVRYLSEEEGGVSHFRPFLDNFAFARLHTRLCVTKIFRWFGRTVGLLPE